MLIIGGALSGWKMATFDDRAARSRFVARRFAPYLTESVLDVGCYEAPLRGLLREVRYFGVDVAGTPDLRLDLDTAKGCRSTTAPGAR